jgi:hypothetical protein
LTGILKNLAFEAKGSPRIRFDGSSSLNKDQGLFNSQKLTQDDLKTPVNNLNNQTCDFNSPPIRYPLNECLHSGSAPPSSLNSNSSDG